MSETTKAFLYFGSVLSAVAVGSVVTYGAVEGIVDAPQRLNSLNEKVERLAEENADLRARLESIEKSEFVRFGDRLAIFDPQESAIVITRHASAGDGGAGYYLNSYEWGRTGLGRKNTQVWALRKVD
jgi:hypothetical protein